MDHCHHAMAVGRRIHVTRRPNDSISFSTRLVRHSQRSHRAGSSKFADLRQSDTCAPTASGVIRHQHVDLLGRRSAPLFLLPFAALTPSLPHPCSAMLHVVEIPRKALLELLRASKDKPGGCNRVQPRSNFNNDYPHQFSAYFLASLQSIQPFCPTRISTGNTIELPLLRLHRGGGDATHSLGPCSSPI